MTTATQRLAKLLKIRYPIIQAPMAGGLTTPELVSAVSAAGGLGSFGAAYMHPEDLRQAIRAVKQRTAAPYQVNLFVPDDPTDYQPERYDSMLHTLEGIYRNCDVAFPVSPLPAGIDFAAQVQVLIEERTPIVSFTFGIPEEHFLAGLRRNGTILMGTATCVAEARALAETGFDAVVAQGYEAGGHRATFHSTLRAAREIPNVGLFALLPQLVSELPLPVVASGAIMNGSSLAAAIALGAAGCQLGTAFMGCPEAAVSLSWRQALGSSGDTCTSLTRVFSGRLARGIRNRFMEEMEPVSGNIPPFEVQTALTSPLRAAARRRDDPGYQSLWAGQAARLIRGLPAGELVHTLIEEMVAASQSLGTMIRSYNGSSISEDSAGEG